MSTEYENKMCNFLAQKENLPIAMEIADLIGKVQGRIGNEFWERVRASLQRKLEEANLHGSWVCQELKKDKKEDFALGVFLDPKPARDPETVFRYDISEEEGNTGRYHIYQGICPPSRGGPRAVKKAVSDLQGRLLDEGYERSKGWIAWKYIRDFTSEDEFVLTVADRGDEYASGVAETFWDFFQATRARVEKLNSALGGCGGKPSKSR